MYVNEHIVNMAAGTANVDTVSTPRKNDFKEKTTLVDCQQNFMLDNHLKNTRVS